MKRTFAVLALILTVSGSLAFHRARAQDASAEQPRAGANASAAAPNVPPLDAAKKQYQEAAQRASSLALDLLKRANQPSPDAQAADRRAIRDKLRPLVEESFDARQRLQQAELNELRGRLAEIERSLAQREQRKGAIVDSRIDELLSPSAGRADSGFVYEEVVKDGKRIPIARWIGPGDNPAAPAVSAPTPVNGGSHPGTALSPTPAPLANLPPGTEVRVRYIQEEQVLSNGERRMVTRPVNEIVEIRQSAAPQDNGESSDATIEPRRQSDDRSTRDKAAAAAAEGFDLETRERLAQLDVEQAQAERPAASEELDRLRKLYEKGAAPESAVLTASKRAVDADYAIKRAKLKLEGLARERQTQQFAAEAEILRAKVEIKRAEAKYDAAKATAAAADAEVQKLESDVEAAKANHEFRQKVYKRLQELAGQGTVDIRLLDEKEEQSEAARAALAAAEAALQKGSASVWQAKAGVEEAVADHDLARELLRVAQARHERLSRSHKGADLKQGNPPEAKISAALDDPTELEFVDQPLSDVVQYLKERHQLEIQLDNRALKDKHIGADTPVTFNITGTTLRSALRLMLRELDLTYVLRDEVLLITTKEEAENMASGETLSDRPPDLDESKPSETVPSKPEKSRSM